jgi:predicted AAA+ superfamily ATPase
MINRYLKDRLTADLLSMPVVALLGPRQVGKTTLALNITASMDKPYHYLDLEMPSDMSKMSDPESYLKRFDNTLVIIDEVQRFPHLFEILRGIIDARKRKGERTAQFLLLGSASRILLQQTSETLAGRIRYLELPALNLSDIKNTPEQVIDIDKIWFRGGFPDSFLALNERESWQWRFDFVTTYLERDLPMMGVTIAPNQLKRLWTMLAHYNGSILNLSELGRNLELSHNTIKSYIDTLSEFYMLRLIPSWSGNLKKRLIKAPKIYFRDTGILHQLLNVTNMEVLLSHPAIGASWESFVIENICTVIDSRWQVSHYRSATQVEVDLILQTPSNEIWAIEIKRSSAPKISRGFYEACKDIKAIKQFVVVPESETYLLKGGAEVIGLVELLEIINEFNKTH